MEWEDIIAGIELVSVEVVPEGVVPGAHSQATIYEVTLRKEGREEAFLISRRILEPDMEIALSSLHDYAINGMWSDFEEWKKDNMAEGDAYVDMAKEYYEYCRDTYLRLERLLGEEAMKEYINIL